MSYQDAYEKMARAYDKMDRAYIQLRLLMLPLAGGAFLSGLWLGSIWS